MIGRIAGAAALAFVAAMAFAPGAASAGGFSTVGLDSPPPVEPRPGEAWDARFTLLAHGRTPMSGIDPIVRIERADGTGARTIAAHETSRPGTYRARVVFPAAGRWTVGVSEYRDISPPHTFGEVRVRASGASAAADASGGGSGLGLALAAAVSLALGLVAGGVAWLAQRRPVASPPAGAR